MTKEDFYKIWYEPELGEWVATKGFGSQKTYNHCGRLIDVLKYLLNDIEADFDLIELKVKAKKR